MALAPAARALAAAAAVALVAGCTSPSGQDTASPTPSPAATGEAAADERQEVAGERVAVVVPPAGIVAPVEGAALARVADELAADPPQGIAEVRVSRASSLDFTRDLAEVAVADDYDVVCIVGTGAAELVLEVARAHRATRFCTTDARIEGGPVNLVAVGVDPAALVEAGAVAIGTAPAPVGFLVSPQVGAVEALTETFTTTVAPPRRVTPAPAPTGGATAGTGATSPPAPAAPPRTFVTVAARSGATAQANAGAELADGRPSRALVLATPGGAAAAAAAATTGAELVVVADWAVDPDGELPANLLVGLTVDWGALLRGAIDAARNPDASQVQLRGVDAGVLGTLPGRVAEAPAAAARTDEHLRRSAE